MPDDIERLRAALQGAEEIIAAPLWRDFVLRLVERDRELITRHKVCAGCVPGVRHEPFCHRCAQYPTCDEIKAALAFWCPDPAPGVDGG